MNLFPVYPLFDIQLTHGEGAYVWDSQGTKYLDFYGGHAVISIGHSHPHYVKRIADQLKKLSFYSNSVQNPLQTTLASKLGALSGYPSYDLFLCNSGAEANENALKLASFQTGRDQVIAFKKGFHGRTSLAVAATDNPKVVAPVNAHHQVKFMDLGDLDSIMDELSKQKTCAVIIEGIQGVGGIQEWSSEHLQKLQKDCQETGTILIADEVQSGYGRTGKFFAHQHDGLQPDLITVAKGMGNGFPIGGVLIHPQFESWPGMLGTTFGGNHLACAAGLAVLEVLEDEKLIENASDVGNYLKEELKQIEGIQEVRGKGLMIGLEFETPIKEMRKKLLFEHKVFTGTSSNPNVLRLLPPLNIDRTIADLFLEKFVKTFNLAQVS